MVVKPRLLLLLVRLAVAGTAGSIAAQTLAPGGVYALPADRVTVWRPGVPGGIPTYEKVHAVLAAPAQSADARPMIQGALDAAGVAAKQDGAGRIVQLLPGTFSVAGALFLPSGVVLRGAGPDLTRLIATGNEHPLVVIGASLRPHATDDSVNLRVTGAKGATSVQVIDAA